MQYNARALIDTGAVHSNYINKNIADALIKAGAVYKDTDTSHVVCTPLSCSTFVGQITIKLMFNKIKCCNHIFNSYKNKNKKQKLCDCEKAESITLTCTIISSPYDIIIGRPTIIQHDLLTKLKFHFTFP